MGFVSARDINVAGVLGGLRFSTGREAGYILKLLWYLGLARAKYQDGRFFYALNSEGNEYYRLLCKGDKRATALLLYKAIVRWKPMRVLLSYIAGKGQASLGDMVRDLGGDMLYWTKIMSTFGFKIPKGSVRKPYNTFVLRNCLLPIAEELGLVERLNDRFRLTSLGKSMVSEKSLGWEIVRSRPREPFIYAAICSTLLSSTEAILVSPWIDVKVAEKLVQGIKENSSLSEIRIIVREPAEKGSTRLALKLLVEKLSQIGISVNIRATPRRGSLALHAKVFTSNRECVITSANLQYTSLWKNFEVGVYYKQDVPEPLLNLLEDLWEISKTITIRP